MLHYSHLYCYKRLLATREIYHHSDLLIPCKTFAIWDICHYLDVYYYKGFCHLGHLPVLRSLLIQEAFVPWDICQYLDLYHCKRVL